MDRQGGQFGEPADSCNCSQWLLEFRSQCQNLVIEAQREANAPGSVLRIARISLLVES